MEKLCFDNLPQTDGCVLTIGNFDGVHLGHSALMKQTVEKARELKLPSLVLTFIQHPQSLLSSDSFKYLLGQEDKEKLIALTGIDKYLAIDFKTVKDWSPQEFINTLLVDKLNVRYAVCGCDFAFGKGGSGTPELMKTLLGQRGIGCTVTDKLTADGEPISSTRLRALVAAGDMEGAARLLGRLYSFNLPVVHGRRLGTKLGSPTINQLFPTDRAMPAFGVYAVLCGIEGKLYGGVANIGVKPTVGEVSAPLCETYIFDFDGDLYGKEVRIYLCKHLRGEKRFESLDALRAQIAKDSATAEAALRDEGFYKSEGDKLL